ncbi:hypothetical protein D3C84_985650 [compost metagenome]
MLLLLAQLLLQFLHALEQHLHRDALLAASAFGFFTRLRALPQAHRLFFFHWHTRLLRRGRVAQGVDGSRGFPADIDHR